MTRTVFEKADVIPLVAEVFRELGYEGASLSRITERTGLSKGSLYHFFPDGKEAIAAEVLAHIETWFAENVFQPLERDEPGPAIDHMWKAVDEYFHSGRRVCLVGAFSLDETRDRFAKEIRDYFVLWVTSLRRALIRAGVEVEIAEGLAEEAVLGVQGALILARAVTDDSFFARAIARLSANLSAHVRQGASSKTSHVRTRDSTRGHRKRKT